jgi:hypothetical protein
MDIHNDAIKAMRYDTPGGHSDDAPKKADTAAVTEALAAALADEEDEF